MPTLKQILTAGMQDTREMLTEPLYAGNPSIRTDAPCGERTNASAFSVFSSPLRGGLAPFGTDEVILGAWAQWAMPAGDVSLFAGWVADPGDPNDYGPAVLVEWDASNHKINFYADDTGPWAGAPNLTLVDSISSFALQSRLYRRDQWMHIGLYALRAAAMELTLYVDGTAMLNYVSGGGTEWLTAPEIWTTCSRVGGASVGWNNRCYWQDFYIMDVTGEGDQIPPALRSPMVSPEGAGNSTQWTPLASTNWSNVDDPGIPPDDDTTYVETATTGNKDTYEFEDLVALTDVPYSYTFHGDVLVQTVFKNVDDGEATQIEYEHVARVGAAESADGTFSNTTLDTYTLVYSLFTQQPDTSAWNFVDFNAAEFGYESK